MKSILKKALGCLKIASGIVAFVVMIIATIFAITLGILGYPYYLIKRYINNRIQTRKNW